MGVIDDILAGEHISIPGIGGASSKAADPLGYDFRSGVSLTDQILGPRLSANTPPPPEEPGFGTKALHAVGSVVGLPKAGIDWLARTGAEKLYGLKQPEGATTGSMVRAAAGLTPEADYRNQGYAPRLAGKALEFGSDLATDPVTWAVGGLGKAVEGGVAAERVLGRVGAEAAPEALAALQAAVRQGQIVAPIQKGATAVFTGLMGAGALQEGAETAKRFGQEGWNPATAESALGTGLAAGGAYLGARHFGRTPDPFGPRPQPQPGSSIDKAVAMLQQEQGVQQPQPGEYPTPPMEPGASVGDIPGRYPPINTGAPGPETGYGDPRAFFANLQQETLQRNLEDSLAQPPAEPRLAPQVGRVGAPPPQTAPPILDLIEQRQRANAARAEAERAAAAPEPPPPPPPEPVQTIPPELPVEQPAETPVQPLMAEPAIQEPAPVLNEPPVITNEPPSIPGELPRGVDRRQAEAPVPEDRRLADRRAAIAQEVGLPPEHPAVERLAQGEAESRRDPLTGIGNRAHWNEIQKTLNPETDHAMVMDLQKFKPINDTYGHAAGDDVLRHVAGVLRNHLGDDAARFGGDEFGGILRGLSPEEVQAKADAIKADLAAARIQVKDPKTGQDVDIPGIRAHIGVGRNVEAADLAANAAAEASRKGGRGDIQPTPENQGGTEPGAGSVPPGGLGGRPEELAPPPPAEPPVTPKYATQASTRRAPGFYSQLRKVVDETKQGAARGSDWTSFLRDPKRAVKADEMKWTGLDDFLRERGDKRVTKEEIQRFLQENEVRVEEVRFGRGSTQEEDAKAFLREKMGEDPENLWRGGYVDQARMMGWTGERSELPAKHGGLVFPGGENYREVLLTLPVKVERRPIPPFERWLDEQPWYRSGQKVLPENQRVLYRQWVEREKVGHNVPSFRGGHFEEPNVLAHVRLNDRTDAQGKRVLFVEEVQSDWAQKGRREGFKSETPDFSKWRIEPDRPGEYRVYDENGTHLDTYVAPSETAMRARLPEIQRMRIERGFDHRVPGAPFVTSTEGWTNLALKRILRMAAEEGYDRVAWTTGEQQRSRYDLSKHIDSIQWTEHSRQPGMIGIDAFKDGATVIEKRVPLTELDEVVGKDLADKIRTAHAAGETEGDFSGLDLKVGGEGMAGFYDKILPSVMGKLGKKWGAKVGETQVESYTADTGGGRKYLVSEQAPGRWHVVDSDENLKAGPFKTEAEALAHPLMQDRVSVHAIDITQEMRRSVMQEGFPQFRATERPGLGVTTEQVKSAFAVGSVKEVGDGAWDVALPGDRGIRVRVRPEGIEYDVDAFRKGYSREKGTAEQIVGAWKQLDRGGLIWLAKEADQGTIHHEAFHAAMDMALSEKERAAVLKRYGSEESAAEAYAKWDPAMAPNSWFTRVLAFAKRIYRSFRPSWESAFERTRSGEAYGRAETGAPREAYAARPNTATTETPEFRRWFGASKVVDPEGKPLVVYHGTPAASAFTVFRTEGGSSPIVQDRLGAHFGSRRAAESRLNTAPANAGPASPRVMPLYLRIERPFTKAGGEPFSESEMRNRFNVIAERSGVDPRRTPRDAASKVRATLIAEGYDGVAYRNSHEDRGSTSYIAFHPEQIKSATENIGTFDPNNPDIRFAARSGQPGQRGLAGIAEDVPAEKEKPKAPEQRAMFGAGEMLQPTEAKVTEGREAGGPLFTQEREAAIKADRERQGALYSGEVPRKGAGEKPPEQAPRAPEGGERKPRDFWVRAHEAGLRARAAGWKGDTDAFWREALDGRYKDSTGYDFEALANASHTAAMFFKAGIQGHDLPRWATGERYGRLKDGVEASYNQADQRTERGISLMRLDSEPRMSGELLDAYETIASYGGKRQLVRVGGFLAPWRGVDGEPLLLGAEELPKLPAPPGRGTPEQRAMFGAGEMLQPTEAKVTEGREAGGPLFTQEREAAINADQERQGTLPTESSQMPKAATLEKPIPGRGGSEIVGYEWRSKVDDVYSESEGALVTKRVSDWDASDTSTGTGRDIVHVFYVQHPDGSVTAEGVRSAQNILGIRQERLRTIAQHAREKRERTERERPILARQESRQAENVAQDTPQLAARDYRLRNKGFTHDVSDKELQGTILYEKNGKYVRYPPGERASLLETEGWTRSVNDPLQRMRETSEPPVRSTNVSERMRAAGQSLEAELRGGKPTKYATAPAKGPEPIPETPEQPGVRSDVTGRRVQSEETPRVETKVGDLRRAEAFSMQEPSKLGRETIRHWEDLDPEVQKYLREHDDKQILNAAAQGRIDDVGMMALDARVRDARERFDEARSKAQEAADSGQPAGDSQRQAIEGALDAAALEAARLARGDVEVGTRIARALAARARVMEAGGVPGDQLLRRIFRDIQGVTDKQAADLLRIYHEDPRNLPDALTAAMRPKKMSKYLELWKAGLVSAPGTQIANIAGNVGEQGFRIGETLTAKLVDRMLSGERQRVGAEGRAEIQGALSRSSQALGNLGAELKDILTLAPEKIDISKPLDYQTGAIKGKTGRAVRIPFRLLGTFDAFFKDVGGAAELGKLAYRKARAELGAMAQESRVRARAEEIRAEALDPENQGHEDLLRKVSASRQSRTFQAAPGPLMQSLLRMRSQAPWLNVVFPFLQTPGNIAKLTIERSPLGIFKAKRAYDAWKGAISRGADKATVADLRGEAVDAIARPLFGTAVLGAFLGVAKSGGMTGSGPNDAKDRKALLDSGWQPYSFVINGPKGKTYVPFNRFEPVSTLLGFAADLSEASDKKKAGDIFDKLAGPLLSNLTSKTYLQGLSDAVEVLNKPKESFGRYATSFVGSHIPNIVAKVAQAYDPTIRDTSPAASGIAGLPERVLKTVESRIPGLSTTLPAQTATGGGPAQRPGNAASRFLSPIQISQDKPEADLERLLVDIDAVPGTPSRDMTIPGTHGKKVRLTDEEYSVLKESKTVAADYLRRLTASATFRRLDPEEQRRQVLRIYDRARELQRNRLVSDPAFRRRAREVMREQSASP